MTSFAEVPEDKRRLAVEEAAARMGGILPVIVEKDYWVSWLLGRIFENAQWSSQLIFKGGTSLSKVFGVIDRFSEDIDLSVAPEALGFKEATLEGETSKGRRAKLFENLQEACAAFVKARFGPDLEKTVAKKLGARRESGSWLTYKDDPRTHSPILLFEYPSALTLERGYIEPAVKLEFGSLTDQQPTGTHSIRSMLGDVIPAFEAEKEQVVALEVERTFWEKATILHAEYHRPSDKPIPDRYARHYSDFAALWKHSSREGAMRRLDLLDQVAAFKTRFFGSGWSHYETAKLGTLKLAPPQEREAELKRDYAKMAPMFLKSVVPFDEILTELGKAEQDINSRASAP